MTDDATPFVRQARDHSASDFHWRTLRDNFAGYGNADPAWIRERTSRSIADPQ